MSNQRLDKATRKLEKLAGDLKAARNLVKVLERDWIAQHEIVAEIRAELIVSESTGAGRKGE